MNIIDLLLQINLLEINWYNLDSLGNLGLKFGLNLVVMYLIVMQIYRPLNRKTTYVFTYFIFNILIFFLCHLMLNSNVGVGFGFGLFALFSIMRYRTMTIDIKDMTYLFSVVCIAVLNALSTGHSNVLELVLINGTIVFFIYFMEKLLFQKQLKCQQLIYEQIELIKPQHFEQLKEDLGNRLGQKVLKVEVLSLNYLNDSAVLDVYYEEVEVGLLSSKINLDKPLK